MNSLPDLHDATLDTLQFDWKTARLQLRFKIGVEKYDFIVVEAMDVTYLDCPRLLPWGPSNSVNGAKLERLDVDHMLEIEMQSGDLLKVSCSGLILKLISEEARDA
jgi:hypothetical protein